jgi:hypothetical protein
VGVDSSAHLTRHGRLLAFPGYELPLRHLSRLAVPRAGTLSGRNECAPRSPFHSGLLPRSMLRSQRRQADRVFNKELQLHCKASRTKGHRLSSDLYAFPELPHDQAQFIEQQFFDYADRVASNALQMLLTGDNRWTSETRSAWSRFVIGLHLRHPDAIPEPCAAARSIWNSNGEEFQRRYELIREPSDPATFDQRVAKIDPLVPIKVEVNAIIRMIDNEKVNGYINNMA